MNISLAESSAGSHGLNRWGTDRRAPHIASLAAYANIHRLLGCGIGGRRESIFGRANGLSGQREILNPGCTLSRIPGLLPLAALLAI